MTGGILLLNPEKETEKFRVLPASSSAQANKVYGSPGSVSEVKTTGIENTESDSCIHIRGSIVQTEEIFVVSF